MPDPIEFYFGFSSPYGYLASTRIDALAEKHGRAVTWRPFLLGAAFKATGQQPLVEQPLRGPYHRRDFARSARLAGVPFRLPEPFPFAEGRPITAVEAVVAVAAPLGIAADALTATVEDPAIKARLRQETERALAR